MTWLICRGTSSNHATIGGGRLFSSNLGDGWSYLAPDDWSDDDWGLQQLPTHVTTTTKCLLRSKAYIHDNGRQYGEEERPGPRWNVKLLRSSFKECPRCVSRMPGVDDACPNGASPGHRSEYKLDFQAGGSVISFSNGYVSGPGEM
jgi:hypothetical protein